MKTLKVLISLFFISHFLNSCTKNPDLNAPATVTKFGRKIIIPENFFKESPVPGTVEEQSTNVAVSNSASFIDDPQPDNGDDPVVLNTQLANPYTVPNMQQAYNTLYGNSVNLRATNLYIRFKPANAAQLAVLEDSLELNLFTVVESCSAE